VDFKGLRAGAIYDADAKTKIRKSHENPIIKELYDTYLEKPNSHKAHKILHTTYEKRNNY
jgi:NADP-reducing hydrogenase subunit HndD